MVSRFGSYHTTRSHLSFLPRRRIGVVALSTGGLGWKQIDDLVSFFDHRRVHFAIMHCVSIYPTPDERMQLQQIEMLRNRYPRTTIGFSTDTDVPRAAVTHFEIERALPRTTLLRVRLETGRTHQIRAHLRAIGHDVVGDPEYGTPGRLGLGRQFLHATRLAFAHPVTGEPIDVSSPLPPDLQAALARAADE